MNGTIIIDQIPLFPAHILATNGLKALGENGVDIVITPYFQDLVKVPSVTNVASTYFMAWDSEIDYYQAISFKALADNVADSVLTNNLQPLSPALTSIANLTTSANQMIYATGPNAYATTSLTAFARTILDDANAGAVRTTLGLGSLSTASTINNDNWSGAALSVANGGTGASDQAGARASMGLGSLAVLNSINNDNWSGAALSVANGGTGAPNAATARTNLGLNSYKGNPQVPTVGGLLTASHGLGRVPDQWWATLVCIVANNGYSAGDELNITFQDANGNGYGVSVMADATTIYARIGNPGLGIIAIKSSGVDVSASIGEWNVRLWAR